MREAGSPHQPLSREKRARPRVGRALEGSEWEKGKGHRQEAQQRASPFQSAEGHSDEGPQLTLKTRMILVLREAKGLY